MRKTDKEDHTQEEVRDQRTMRQPVDMWGLQIAPVGLWGAKSRSLAGWFWKQWWLSAKMWLARGSRYYWHLPPMQTPVPNSHMASPRSPSDELLKLALHPGCTSRPATLSSQEVACKTIPCDCGTQAQCVLMAYEGLHSQETSRNVVNNHILNVKCYRHVLP